MLSRYFSYHIFLQSNPGGYRFIAPLQQIGARDITSHTKLKFRQPSQQSQSDLASRDFKADLAEREQKNRDKQQLGIWSNEQSNIALIENPILNINNLPDRYFSELK